MEGEESGVTKRMIWAGLILLLLAAVPAARAEGYWPPREFADMDMEDPASRWCWARSRESDHFILFWEAGFGDDPGGAAVPEDMRVDAEALLAAAEGFYRTETERLKFAEPEYKIQIYLHDQDEWLATGAGYDDKVGALWVSPAACRQAGPTLAHEVGHCFQYLTYCQSLRSGMPDDSARGFRYPHGNGNGFWEQTAQWQSYRDFPEDAFVDSDVDAWFENCHRAFEHEWSRYQSFWLMDYWAQLRGEGAVARVWRESVKPEDALAAYGRLYLGGDRDALRGELYDYAVRAATFDFDGAREYAWPWISGYHTHLYPAEDGFLRVGYASCPCDSGFNVIEVTGWGGGPARVWFRGLPGDSPLAEDDPGVYLRAEAPAGTRDTFNGTVAQEDEGWRYGFAALLTDGSRVYGEMGTAREGIASFRAPEDTARLFFVVLAGGETYLPSRWDEDETTDLQMPYEIRILQGEIAETEN